MVGLDPTTQTYLPIIPSPLAGEGGAKAPGAGAASSSTNLSPTRINQIDFPQKLGYIPLMTNVEQIEQAIATLPRDDIFALAKWFAEFHAKLWDKEITGDVEADQSE
jgi:hypothetical protein